MSGEGQRSRRSSRLRLASSPAQCCAFAPLPPLPQNSILLPRRSTATAASATDWPRRRLDGGAKGSVVGQLALKRRRRQGFLPIPIVHYLLPRGQGHLVRCPGAG